MADGGRAPGADFIENESDALAKPYELTHPLSAEGVANIDDMFRLLFDSVREQEIETEELTEEVDAIVIPDAEESVLKLITVSLTEAQIEAGNTSPPVLVAAQTGKIIVPVDANFIVTKTAPYTADVVWSLRHQAIAGNLTGTVQPTLTGAGTTTTRHSIGRLTTHTYSADPTGAALVMFLNGDPGNPGTGVVTAKVQLAYYLADSIATV